MYNLFFVPLHEFFGTFVSIRLKWYAFCCHFIPENLDDMKTFTTII